MHRHLTLTELDGVPIAHHTVEVATTGLEGPLAMHVVTAGPDDGAPVLLLHGFPDLWYGWHRQIPALARAGYRVIVPDQRGYAGTAKPDDWRAYRIPHLVDDVVGLLDALDAGPAHVVGHDWGGGVAWAVATLRPEVVRTLTVANCPRPSALKGAVLADPLQIPRSWYILFFQIPWLPERLLARDWAVRALAGSAPKGTFSKDDLAIHAEAATLPAMRAAVRWYRAALFGPTPTGTIRTPTQLLWGKQDAALRPSLAQASLTHVDDAELVWFDEAGHWTPQEIPGPITDRILGHLAAHGGPDPYVYKLVDRPTWDAAGQAWSGSEHDARDGFVHLSAAHQVAGTLAKHFDGQTDLVLLAVDPARLPPDALRWEVSRGGARFPHLHGPLPRDAVVRTDAVPDARPDPAAAVSALLQR